MPVWLLQLALAVIPLIGKLIDKFVPDKVSKKRDFKTKKKVIDAMRVFHGKTIEEIAAIGKAREAKRQADLLDP